jgi:hypothetical protein
MADLALGFAPHTGWAIAVLLTGDARSPRVLDRRRVELVPATTERFAYHLVQEWPLQRAARSVADAEDAVDITTHAAVEQLAAAAAAHGTLVAAGVVGEPHEVPALERVQASHTLLHTAEGELYRSALEDAAADVGLTVVPVPPKRTVHEAAAALGVAGDALDARLKDLRKELGPPWTADHRAAAAAALVALHSR